MRLLTREAKALVRLFTREAKAKGSGETVHARGKGSGETVHARGKDSGETMRQCRLLSHRVLVVKKNCLWGFQLSKTTSNMLSYKA